VSQDRELTEVKTANKHSQVESTTFALKHGIKADFSSECHRPIMKMYCDKVTDESMCVGKKRFQFESFIWALCVVAI